MKPLILSSVLACMTLAPVYAQDCEDTVQELEFWVGEWELDLNEGEEWDARDPRPTADVAFVGGCGVLARVLWDGSETIQLARATERTWEEGADHAGVAWEFSYLSGSAWWNLEGGLRDEAALWTGEWVVVGDPVRHGVARLPDGRVHETFELYNETRNEWDKWIDRVWRPRYVGCEHPDYRAFDFMHGAWEMRSDGEELGRLVVQPEAGACGWSEVLEGVGAVSSTGLLTFNQVDDTWVQLVLFEGGLVYELEGGPVDDSFVLEGPINGTAIRVRRSIRPRVDGTILLLLETSIDEGRTWETARRATLHPLE